MVLFHFSEDPGIRRFEPHVPATQPGAPPRVWAVDEWHAPLYYFPRQCPRIVVWALPETTAADRHEWFGASKARMLAFVERGWLERVRAATLFRYTFDAAPFEDMHDAGMHVSRSAVEPISVERIGDLERVLHASGVELRVLEDLTPLRGAWGTTLHASGIRLRNASGWAA